MVEVIDLRIPGIRPFQRLFLNEFQFFVRNTTNLFWIRSMVLIGDEDEFSVFGTKLFSVEFLDFGVLEKSHHFLREVHTIGRTMLITF